MHGNMNVSILTLSLARQRQWAAAVLTHFQLFVF